MRVPWTARRSNQSILKEINLEYSLTGLMLKLNLQSFGHLMQRADSFEKTLMLGKIEGRRRKRWEPRGFSRVAAAFSSYDGDLNLPLGLALGSLFYYSVQLLSLIQLFETPWTTARQASLSITNFQNLPSLTSIESVMPSSHLTVLMGRGDGWKWRE